MSEAPPKDAYHLAALEMKNRLQEVSGSFCLAKWLQVSIHLPTGRTHSCYHPTPHKIPLDELSKNPSALHNTNFKKEQRRQMKEGEFPSECDICWKVENSKDDRVSDRFFRSSEAWAVERFDEIKKLPWDQNVQPAYLEVNFSHACQFKCTYCGPELSSAWMQEMKSRGPYKTQHGHTPLETLERDGLVPISDSEKNPYVSAFWKWWPEAYPSLKVFRMTGGEPLLDENTFRIFEYVKTHPNPELSLSITSNFCPPDKMMGRFISEVKGLKASGKIKDFILFASLDSTGSQAEYIRTGLDYNKFTQNIERYLTEVPYSTVTFINTFNAMSVVGFSNFLRLIQSLRERFNGSSQRIHFDVTALDSPNFLSCQMLTHDYFEKIKYLIQHMREKSFSSSEIEKMQRVLLKAQTPISDESKKRRRIDFFLFCQDLDQREHTNFLQIFPEMKNFWDLCSGEYLSFLSEKN